MCFLRWGERRDPCVAWVFSCYDQWQIDVNLCLLRLESVTGQQLLCGWSWDGATTLQRGLGCDQRALLGPSPQKRPSGDGAPPALSCVHPIRDTSHLLSCDKLPLGPTFNLLHSCSKEVNFLVELITLQKGLFDIRFS